MLDPVNETFTTLTELVQPRYVHAAALLDDGRVLITGGRHITDILSSSEMIDPVSGNISAGPTVEAAWALSATVLDSGDVLVAGGANGGPIGGARIVNASGADPVGGMAVPRWAMSATLLTGGRVLIAGGVSDGGIADAEVYDPVLGGFISVTPMTNARHSHTATRLLDGRVVVVGGLIEFDGLTSVEIFTPGEE